MSKSVFLFKSDKSQNDGIAFYISLSQQKMQRTRKSQSCLVDVLNFLFLQGWLERTPGLEKDGFDFWGKYKRSVKDMLDSIREEAEVGQVLFRNLFKKKKATRNYTVGQHESLLALLSPLQLCFVLD